VGHRRCAWARQHQPHDGTTGRRSVVPGAGPGAGGRVEVGSSAAHRRTVRGGAAAPAAPPAARHLGGPDGIRGRGRPL